MDCTHCESVLLDLCYGELTPAHEREVRAHIHDCTNCRKALSRLEAGQALARHLPDEPPPPELTDRIMRAAEAHARRNNGGFRVRVQLAIESMARIAMTRQVAMATVSLLIVFVGLWSIPELTRRREARTAMVVEPAAEGEAGPSRDVLPAAPEPSAAVPTAEPAAAQPKTRGEYAANERPKQVARKRTAEGPAKEAKSKSERDGERALKDQASARVARVPAPQKAARFAQPPPAAKGGEANATSLADARQEPGRADDLRVRSRNLPADSLDTLSEGSLGSGAAESPSPSAAATGSAVPKTIEDVFRAGVERYRADDFAAAAQLFSRMLESSAPSAQRAAALLYLARSERALGRCDRAIRAYETLVRSYGSAQQSASALSEGVACYDQLGNAAGATRLLEHASSVPSLSVQATKTLQDRSAGKPAAAPATAAEPAPR
jgi:tetratricopeptide (TPR) repeat protein